MQNCNNLYAVTNYLKIYTARWTTDQEVSGSNPTSHKGKVIESDGPELHSNRFLQLLEYEASLFLSTNFSNTQMYLHVLDYRLIRIKPTKKGYY